MSVTLPHSPTPCASQTGGSLPRFPHTLLNVAPALLLALVLALFAGDALAHVKWFAEYDLTQPPRSILQVVSNPHFLALFAMMLPLMIAAGYADSHLGRYADGLNHFLDRWHAWIEPQFFSVMQISILAFFTALFVYGNILLTPELTINPSDRNWVEWVQLSIAVLVLHRRTAFLSALGIFLLYATAVYRFGLFHLLDYPIFLGVAAYIFTVSLFGERRAVWGTNILRVMTGITLMWAGLEKFAYPDWSFRLLDEHPNLMLGFDPEFYMVAAGFIEFSAAYLLITGGLAARVCAALLLFFFATAIPVFGIVDAIGHAVIIMVLSALIFMPNPMAVSRRNPGMPSRKIGLQHAAGYYGALLTTTGLFYGGHWISFGS